jgi:NAD(P)-dependent dehydrogenase (short-subunit alcohol dehydrogenase family)
MNFGLADKKILITGASRGLGRSIVTTLAREGATVAYAARSNNDIGSLTNELKSLGVKHYPLVMDLEPEGSVRDLIQHYEKSGVQSFDGIVHNLGGTMEVNDPFCPIADWRRVWRFNLEIAIELNLHYLPLMKKAKWGRVVHVSSISSMENHGPIPYCASKAALNAYTRSLGRYVAQDGIIVTAILPGAVHTDGGYWDQAARERPEHVERYVRDRMAIGRLGRPEEISGLVAFLCSDQASFCVGSIFPADGGQGRGYFGL